jgi:hypothetical protein
MIDVIDKNHPQWKEATKFVSLTFRRMYGAEVRSFMPKLIRVQNRQRQCRAILGFHDAALGELFLEAYLDEPVEAAISHYMGIRVDRSNIVEVGNLAEAEPGDARMAIIAATAYLRAAGFRWVVFTGGVRLRNAFRRLGLEPKEMIEADVDRLPESERQQWGSYYRDQPVVCFGDIHEGHDNLQELWINLRDTWASAAREGEKYSRA